MTITLTAIHGYWLLLFMLEVISLMCVGASGYAHQEGEVGVAKFLHAMALSCMVGKVITVLGMLAL